MLWLPEIYARLPKRVVSRYYDAQKQQRIPHVLHQDYDFEGNFLGYHTWWADDPNHLLWIDGEYDKIIEEHKRMEALKVKKREQAHQKEAAWKAEQARLKREAWNQRVQKALVTGELTIDEHGFGHWHSFSDIKRLEQV